MNLFDKRLWQAKNLQDFWFRLRWDEKEIHRRLVKKQQVAIDFTPVDPSRVFGIDISHWNGIVNLALGRAAGLSFVIIKAADGTIPSRYFPENRAGAKAARLPWGIYCWLYPGSKIPIGLQVQAWWDLVKNDYPPLGVWIDFEWTSYAGVPANPNSGDLISALDKFQALSGRRAGIYSAVGYTNQYLTRETKWDNETWWLAHYGVATPGLPWGVTKYKFHQFTDTIDAVHYGSDPLITHAFDGDYYNGTMLEFLLEFGNLPEPPPVDPPPDTGGTMTQMIQGTVKANVFLRSGPASSYSSVTINGRDYLSAGQTVEASENQAQWLHLTKIDGQAVSPVWVSAGSSQQYITWGWIDVTNPPPPPPPADETQMLLNEHLEHIHQIKHADGTIEITEKWVGDSSTFLTKVI